MPYVFEQIDALGYDGWLGAEYRPKGGTFEGLVWAEPYGIKAN
jgi:hydroxypyruvate isomerase